MAVVGSDLLSSICRMQPSVSVGRKVPEALNGTCTTLLTSECGVRINKCVVILENYSDRRNHSMNNIARGRTF